MKALCVVRETSDPTLKEKIPTYFEADIQGNSIYKFTLANRTLLLDSKNVIFTEHRLLIEGFISDEAEVIGRAVVDIRFF